MQTRFNIKTETLEHIPGWAFSTWSDIHGRWHFDVWGPTASWTGGGYYSERDAQGAARMSIYRAT
jgi:hypothetical protein